MPRKTKYIEQDVPGQLPLENPRHETFCVLYTGLYRRKAWQAYVNAGYASKSQQGAKEGASRLMANPMIKERIRFINDRALEEEKLHVLDAVRRLGRIATAKIADYMTNGKIDMAKVSDPELSDAVSEVIQIQTKKGIHTRLKLKDDMKALELLGMTEKKPDAQQNNNTLLVIQT